MKRSMGLALSAFALLAASVPPLGAATGPGLAGAGVAGSLPVAALAGDPGLTSQLWRWIGEIWPELACGMDPNGQCAMAPGKPRAVPRSGKVRPDLACTGDPNGGCASSNRSLTPGAGRARP
jgi:hypothetical protein